MRRPDQQPEVGNRSGKRIPAGPSLLVSPKDSVANVLQIVSRDKALLTERTGKLPCAKLELLLSGIDVLLGK